MCIAELVFGVTPELGVLRNRNELCDFSSLVCGFRVFKVEKIVFY